MHRPQSVLKSATSLILATMILSGCFGFGGAPNEPDPVTLRYITFENGDQIAQALIDRFREDQPHIEFDVESYNQWPEAYLKSEAPPDLMLITPGNLLFSAVEQNLLADITDVWHESGLTEVYPPALSGLSEQNGKQYFLPTGYGWTGIYYNKSVFDEFGLEPPETWDELMLIADTLAAAGITPFVMAGDDPWLTLLWFDYLNLRLNGPDFRRALASGQAQYYDARVQDVLETWLRLLESDYFLEEMATTDDFDAWLTLIRGDGGELSEHKAVMALTGPNFLADVPEQFRSELDFFAFPTVNPSLPRGEVVFPTGYMTPAGAANPEQAISFLRFLGSDEAADVLATQALAGLSYAPAYLGDNADRLPEDLRRGAEIVEQADELVVAYFFNVPLAMQQSLGQIMARMVRAVDRGEQVNVDALMQDMDAARLKHQ